MHHLLSLIQKILYRNVGGVWLWVGVEWGGVGSNAFIY